MTQLPRRTKIQALTGEQLRLLYQHANISPDGEMFVLMICTGMRAGELLALRWQDLDIQARTLTIQRTIHAMGPDSDRPLDQARVIQPPRYFSNGCAPIKPNSRICVTWLATFGQSAV